MEGENTKPLEGVAIILEAIFYLREEIQTSARDVEKKRRPPESLSPESVLQTLQNFEFTPYFCLQKIISRSNPCSS
jgi:hypothetical protein